MTAPGASMTVPPLRAHLQINLKLSKAIAVVPELSLAKLCPRRSR